MARRVAYHGEEFIIAYARDKNGASPGYDFFEALTLPDKAKMMALFQIAGDQGKFYNPEKFGNLGSGLYEFKSFRIRMPFAYSRNERGVILITHGFMKQRNETPPEEIARARRIFEEDQSQTRLTVVFKKHPARRSR